MSTVSFGAQLLSLPNIFKNRFFTIPDYQRSYSWDKKQVEELLKDIDHLINDESTLRHYTGTLVLSQANENDHTEFQVVDGQQRLTTLVILMRMLKEYLPIEGKQETTNLYLHRGEQGNERPVLRLNSDTYDFFERVIIGDGNTDNEPTTLESHERLLDARKLIGKWLAEYSFSGFSGSNIRNTIETELGFLVYAPEENAETGVMFEVINNRGKALSELEKVKNYLVYCSVKLSAKTLRKRIDSDWSKILSYLNIAKKTTPTDEGSFLRYCMVVHFKLNKTNSQNGYDELKKLVDINTAIKTTESKYKSIESIEYFVNFLKTAALWYARLYGQKHDGVDKKLSLILNQIRAQERHASIMPLFLALVIKLQGRGERLVSLLEFLEILNFRVYLARDMTSRNDTGQGDLYWNASSYYHSELLSGFSEEKKKIGKYTLQNDEDALEYCLTEFVLWYSPDELFKNSFVLESESPYDFYHWGGLRYFLMNYEVTLQPNKTINIDKILLSRRDGLSSDYLSVEHLWGQENRNGEGENNRKVDSLEKRRLGNFVLLELRLNIQGNKDGLDLKITKYLDKLGDEPPTDLAHVRKMAKDANKLFNKEKLSKEIKSKNYYLYLYRELNNLQEKRYIDFAMSRWSIKRFLGYKQSIQNSKLEQ